MTTSTAEAGLDGSADVGRRARRLRFLSILAAVNVAIHVPAGLAVTAIAQRFGWPHPQALGLCWAVAGVLAFVGRARVVMPDRRRSGLVVRLIDIPYFIHWCAALWSLIPAVGATLLAGALDVVRGGPIHLPMTAYMWIYASGVVVCGYGVLIRRRWVRVVEHGVDIVDLDAGLEGLRIAHLSDLHIGTFSPRSWGLAWARTANVREPDFAVVTGDMLTSGTAFCDDVADVVGALRARRGVFVSMGNHDYFGGDGDGLVSKLRAQGVQVLRNEGVRVEHNGAGVWVAAIDDTWTRRDDVTRALADKPPGDLGILLAHDPERFDEAAAAGADLVLSGHTHGGQVGFPFAYRAANLATWAYRYTVGLYRRERSVLHVSPGLGTTGPPIRLGVAPEVTVLVLRRARAS